MSNVTLNIIKPKQKPKTKQLTLSDIQKKEPILAEVCGKTCSINKKDKTAFNIHAVKMDKRFKCRYRGFLPLREGDAIIGIAELVKEKYRGDVLLFHDPPFVIMGQDKETLLQSFMIALRGTGFGTLKSHQLVDILVKRYENPDNIIEGMDEMSMQIVHYNSDDKSHYTPYSLVITEPQFNRLMKWWHKQRILRRLYLLGINNKEIKNSELDPLTIYKLCLENPYKITSILVEKCDEIVLQTGQQFNEEFRECGQIVRKVQDLMTNNGWVGAPSRTIARIFPKISDILSVLKDEFDVQAELHTVYLEKPYKVETEITELVTNLLTAGPLGFVMHEKDIEFSPGATEDQRKAIIMALTNNISIITGAGGTGKTRCIRELVYNLEKAGIEYKLASFTGKAVARIREVTDKQSEAMTMHMMISKAKKKKKLGNFRVLILDESSMVTSELLWDFYQYFNHDYKIVLVGDNNQLQPISWGNLFQELLKCGKIPVSYLSQVHRTHNSEDNGILINANLIIEQMDPDYNGPPFHLQTTDNFEILEGDINTVISLIEILHNAGIDKDKLVVISPFNRDLDIINEKCSKMYNGMKRSVKDCTGKVWRLSDRVMMVRNNYDIDVMNGDEGRIVDLDDLTVSVEFKNGIHKFDLEYELIYNEESRKKQIHVGMIKTSYACTIHKFQGSEKCHVIGYVPRYNKSGFLNSNLMYTLVTRAKKNIWMVGDVETMERACTIKPPYRCDNLSQRINL